MIGNFLFYERKTPIFTIPRYTLLSDVSHGYFPFLGKVL